MAKTPPPSLASKPDKQIRLLTYQYQFRGSASGDEPPQGMFVGQAWP